MKRLIAIAMGLSALAPHRLALACARLVPVKILELPIEIPRFQVAQYWHDRFHADPGNQWLRGVFRRLHGSRETASNDDSMLLSESLDTDATQAAVARRG